MLVPKFVRYRGGGVIRNQDHIYLDTDLDSKQLRVNSRVFTQASGSSIGMQTKPQQTVLTTGDVIGAEFSPRYASGIGGGSLIGLKADPILQGTTGNLSGSVRGIESNIDLNDSGVRTITGHVCALRVFPAFGTSTVTGKKSVIVCATPNSGSWDYLFDLEASTGLTAAAGTGDNSAATTNGYATNPANMRVIKVREGSTDYFIPLFVSNA